VYGWYVFEDRFSVIEGTPVTPDPVKAEPAPKAAAK
jgi:hypothetical protein